MVSGIGGISRMTTGYFQIKQTRPVTAGHGYWWVWVLGGYPNSDPDPYPWGTQPVNPPGTSYPPSFTSTEVYWRILYSLYTCLHGLCTCMHMYLHIYIR